MHLQKGLFVAQSRHFGKAAKIDPDINYYALIGLNRGAQESEIKSSYYNLAKKYHPDSTEGLASSVQTDFEDKFKAISAAYEILSDPKRR